MNNKQKLNKFYDYLKSQCLENSEKKCYSSEERRLNIGKNDEATDILDAFVKIVLKNEG